MALAFVGSETDIYHKSTFRAKKNGGSETEKMRPRFRISRFIFALSVGCAGAAHCGAMSSSWHEIRRLDLSKAFHTSSSWKLVVTQGPPTDDYQGGPAPGPILLCLTTTPEKSCDPFSLPMPRPGKGKHSYDGWEPHYADAQLVYPRGKSERPLLLITTASVYAGDGDQLVVRQLFDYLPGRDAFARIYARATGTNENEDVRFVRDGPLEGAVISAEPTQNAPFGYWIEVNRFTPQRTYRPVLRYRSATHYGDGNRLAVIDSEMPNIEQRLGLWRSGEPLPRPRGCKKPHLKRGALWCD